jgi:hypothetical protein
MYNGQVQMYKNRFRNGKLEGFEPNFGVCAAENGIIFGENTTYEASFNRVGRGGGPPIFHSLKQITV